jgi:uncharacterized membrane protein
MDAFILDWLNLFLRWFHIIVGIAWIGASFHFIWLDYSLRPRDGMAKGVYGTSWLVHGGGFYHVEKYLVAPEKLPDDLHWFKWEAYLTFLSGFALLAVQYYWNASIYLVDPAILPISGGAAVAISVVSLAVGWLIYNALCRLALKENTALLAVAVFILIVGSGFLYTHVFSGRGAFIHTGAMIGTIMAANVFMVIIPNQKKITASLLKGEAPDPALGATGKQRSLHNNYLTLPVLLFMVSSHYPFLYSRETSWLVIALIVLAGGLIRHFLNRTDAGVAPRAVLWALAAATIALLGAITLTTPRVHSGSKVTDAAMMKIVQTHCVMCHAAVPTHDAFKGAEPPKGVVLTSPDLVRRHAQQVIAQAVQGRAMPIGNETGMSDDERAALGAWLAQP